jgi:hypothetical protein
MDGSRRKPSFVREFEFVCDASERSGGALVTEFMPGCWFCLASLRRFNGPCWRGYPCPLKARCPRELRAVADVAPLNPSEVSARRTQVGVGPLAPAVHPQSRSTRGYRCR